MSDEEASSGGENDEADEEEWHGITGSGNEHPQAEADSEARATTENVKNNSSAAPAASGMNSPLSFLVGLTHEWLCRLEVCPAASSKACRSRERADVRGSAQAD